MELDIYLPQQKLVFEYQGEQHYFDCFGMGNNNRDQKQRDEEKRISCKQQGLTLIEIPYWWDLQITTLIALIHKHRPDLFPTLRNDQPST